MFVSEAREAVLRGCNCTRNDKGGERWRIRKQAGREKRLVSRDIKFRRGTSTRGYIPKRLLRLGKREHEGKMDEEKIAGWNWWKFLPGWARGWNPVTCQSSVKRSTSWFEEVFFSSRLHYVTGRIRLPGIVKRFRRRSTSSVRIAASVSMAVCNRFPTRK